MKFRRQNFKVKIPVNKSRKQTWYTPSTWLRSRSNAGVSAAEGNHCSSFLCPWGMTCMCLWGSRLFSFERVNWWKLNKATSFYLKETEKIKNYFNYGQCVKEMFPKLIFSGSETNLPITHFNSSFKKCVWEVHFTQSFSYTDTHNLDYSKQHDLIIGIKPFFPRCLLSKDKFSCVGCRRQPHSG